MTSRNKRTWYFLNLITALNLNPCLGILEYCVVIFTSLNVVHLCNCYLTPNGERLLDDNFTVLIIQIDL